MSHQHCKTGPENHLTLSSRTLSPHWHCYLFSNFRYLKVEGFNVLESLNGSILDTESDTESKTAEETLQRNGKKLFDGHLIDGKEL